MSDIPSLARRIQTQETDFRSPVSESTMQKVGGSINFILDHSVIYPGFIMPFAGPETAVPPASAWLICDGRAVSRTTYANLFAAIGTYYGIGDGSTTFSVPDYRGTFLRMVDRTLLKGPRGFDPDEGSRSPAGTGTSIEPGSYQADAFQSHYHHVPFQSGSGPTQLNAQPSFTDPSNFSPATDSAGGAETRGKNYYVLMLIKT